jgi:murein DD-endopeptidase MepM/ murein hydrolase activator NlpD
MSFESCYLHLSKIEVKAGDHVAQKTVIAESGNTGRLTTGPHLHFGLLRGGRWVNPLNQNFPRAEPLPKALLPRYRAVLEELQGRLESPHLLSRSVDAPR